MRTLWSRASRINRVLRVVAVAGVALGAITVGTTALAQASDAATSRSLVNSARSAAGLGALAADSRLDAMARAQAQRMADRDAIYHNPNLKSDADAAGVNWEWIGENVGVGPDVGSIHDGFMASPGHHENVVYRDYNVIGTGVAVGRDGSLFVAQVFAGLAAPALPAPRPLETAAPVSAAAASAPAPAASAPSSPRASSPDTATVAPVVVVHAAQLNAVVGGLVDGETRL